MCFQFSVLLGKDHRRTRVANAYFSLFMAIGNVLGYATGAYSGWFKIFPFTLTSACKVNCANLKAAFLLDIVFIMVTTFISISAVKEQRLDSINEGRPEESHEAFLWELFGTFKYLSGPVWLILLVTSLNWIGWFPFLLFDTDWMGREIYHGEPNQGQNYNDGVRMGAFGLMFNSVVLGLTSVFMEKLCRRWGAGFAWGISNVIMFLCFVAMLIIAYVASNVQYDHGQPPNGVVIAALVVFSILGIPLAVSFFIHICSLMVFKFANNLKNGVNRLSPSDLQYQHPLCMNNQLNNIRKIYINISLSLSLFCLKGIA